jgi:hypothetical protein
MSKAGSVIKEMLASIIGSSPLWTV